MTEGVKGFVPGNQLWKLRAFHGRPRLYENAEELWSDCCAYFDWATKNTIKQTQVSVFEGIVTKTKVPRMRAMSKAGLCVYLGISQDAWAHLAKSKDPKIREVRETVNAIIIEQKFTGAAAGQLNAMLIARDLNLKERSTTEVRSTSSSVNLNAHDLRGLNNAELAQLEHLLSRAQASAEEFAESKEPEPGALEEGL